MTAALEETAFSDLINKPKSTLDQLGRTQSHRLRLRRRDGADLYLVTADRTAQENEVNTAATRMFAALMRHEESAKALVIEVIGEAFPWTRFLPAADVRSFAEELVETLRAAEDIANPAPVAQLITEWRHTAEVWADPVLRTSLRSEYGDADDAGPVPAPGGGA